MKNSNIIVSIIQAIANSLCQYPGLVTKGFFVSIVRENGTSIETATEEDLKIRNGIVHFGFRYWAKDWIKSSLAIQDYLLVYTLFNKSCSILTEEILDYAANIIDEGDFHNKSTDGLKTAFKMVKHIVDRLSENMGEIYFPERFADFFEEEPLPIPIMPSPCTETAFDATEYRYIFGLANLAAMRDKKDIRKKIHDNIIELSGILAKSAQSAETITVICTKLQETIHLFEKSIITDNNMTLLEADISTAFKRIQNKKISEEMKSTAFYSYSLLSWILSSINKKPMSITETDIWFFIDMLRRVYSNILLAFLPEISDKAKKMYMQSCLSYMANDSLEEYFTERYPEL